MPSTQIRQTAQKKSAFIPLALSWLVPGYGYFINGHKRRAVFFFLILELTFLLGAVLRGSILVPVFSFRDPAFNLVNVLTFITQMFNGGLGIVSMLPEIFGARAHILPYNEAYVWADLGAFFLLVSGGMNYFVLVSTWDHFYAPAPKAIPADTEKK